MIGVKRAPLPNVQRVLTVGPRGDDLVDPGSKGGNLSALDSGRLALFPWQHEPSRLRRRIADSPGHAWHDGHVHGRNLGERQLEDAMPAVLDTIPTEAVRITIDKDVLPEHEALTKRVPGTDLRGEYSPP